MNKKERKRKIYFFIADVFSLLNWWYFPSYPSKGVFAVNGYIIIINRISKLEKKKESIGVKMEKTIIDVFTLLDGVFREYLR